MDGEGTLGRGHGNGGRGLRRQRSLEWRERRGYGPSAQSSSDDEENSRHAVGAASVSSAGRGARSPGQVFASLLAQQYGSEWWYNWCLMPWSRGLRRPGEKFRGRRWPVSRATCLGEGTVFDGSYRGTYWAGGGGELVIYRRDCGFSGWEQGKSITVAVIDFVRHGILVLLVGFVFFKFFHDTFDWLFIEIGNFERRND